MNEITRLKKRLEDQQVLLDQERLRKRKKPIEKMAEEGEDRIDSYDFFCDVCQEDFSGPCYRTVHRLLGYPVSVYRAKCPDCEEESVRLITHRDEDMFYDKSTKVRRVRNQYAWETLQADEVGFRTHYGDPFPKETWLNQQSEHSGLKKNLRQGFKNVII